MKLLSAALLLLLASTAYADYALDETVARCATQHIVTGRYFHVLPLNKGVDFRSGAIEIYTECLASTAYQVQACVSEHNISKLECQIESYQFIEVFMRDAWEHSFDLPSWYNSLWG